MKITQALLISFVLTVAAGAADPAPKTRSTVPGPYPSIIRMKPAEEPGQEPSKGIIQSELGGREMQFLQIATQTGTQLLALVELAKGKNGSEQIKAVSEMLASTQATESKEVARLVAAKQLVVRAGSMKALKDELSALSGGKFEKAWIERLIAINEAGVAAYEMGAKSDDADVHSFAEKMLPVAKARLQMANRLGGHSSPAKPETPAAPSAAKPEMPAAPNAAKPKTPAAPNATEPAASDSSAPRSIPPPIAPATPPKVGAKP